VRAQIEVLREVFEEWLKVHDLGRGRGSGTVSVRNGS
jgi:hypothetical protein